MSYDASYPLLYVIMVIRRPSASLQALGSGLPHLFLGLSWLPLPALSLAIDQTLLATKKNSAVLKPQEAVVIGSASPRTLFEGKVFHKGTKTRDSFFFSSESTNSVLKNMKTSSRTRLPYEVFICLSHLLKLI